MTPADQRSAIRDRVRLIANERGLADDVEAVMRNDDTLLDFGIRHGLSFDWLLLGDLRGWRNFPRS